MIEINILDLLAIVAVTVIITVIITAINTPLWTDHEE